MTGVARRHQGSHRVRALIVCWLLQAGCSSELWGPGLLEDDPELEQRRAYNLSRLNEIREQHQLPSYVLDACLNDVAELANDEWILDGEMHSRFTRECLGQQSCVCDWAQENMGYGRGDTTGWEDDLDASLELMMNEGPGGGHHDNIVSTQWTRVGIGIRVFNGMLHFTNDFGR